MSSVTHFKQYLLKKMQEKNREHCAIYNYLNCFCHDEQELTVDLFTQFYRKILLFPYWQSHLNSLQKTLTTELASFAKLYYSTEFDPEELVPADQWQLITIQQETDLVKMVSSHLQGHSSKGDRVRALPLDKERVLGLVLKLDGNLDVFTFGPLATINQGKLEPLSTLSTLYYSSQYELRPAYQHTIEDMNLNFIHFKIKGEKATGYECQNFYFQQSTDFKQKNINEIDILFCLLKKIESLFIQPRSDPYYKQLITSLHEHYRQILISHSNNSFETQQILSQARKALKNLYPHDRLLFLLTANIDFHFRKQQKKQTILSNPQ